MKVKTKLLCVHTVVDKKCMKKCPGVLLMQSSSMKWSMAPMYFISLFTVSMALIKELLVCWSNDRLVEKSASSTTKTSQNTVTLICSVATTCFLPRRGTLWSLLSRNQRSSTARNAIKISPKECQGRDSTIPETSSSVCNVSFWELACTWSSSKMDYHHLATLQTGWRCNGRQEQSGKQSYGLHMWSTVLPT